MEMYHKIQTMFLRDPETNHKTLLEGYYSRNEFEYLKDNRWHVTEKIDGTNIRVISNDHVISFEGRTDKAEIPKHLFEYLNNKFNDEIMMETFRLKANTITLYGEGYGAKIQKGGGRYISNDVSFILFDVKIDNIWLRRDAVEDIASSLNIDVVPFIGYMTLPEIHEYVKSGCEVSRISEDKEYTMEGVVARPSVELFDRMGRRIITKLKVKDFKG